MYADAPQIGGREAFAADGAFAAFARVDRTLGPLRAFIALPPLGACTAYHNGFDSEDLSYLPDETWAAILMNAATIFGGKLTVASGDDVRPLSLDSSTEHRYAARLGGSYPFSGPPMEPFLHPGPFKVAGNGEGDLGKFAARVNMPNPVVWRDFERLDTVDRTRELLIRWDRAGASGPVFVAGAALDRRTQSGTFFLCREEARRGKLSVPSEVLRTIPAAGPDGRSQVGSLFVGAGLDAKPTTFAADGLQFGAAIALNVTGRTVRYR